MTTLVATVEWIDSPLTPRIQWELNADPPRPRPGQEPPPFQFVVVNGEGEVFARRYEHVQSTASAVWTVNHNLGRRPAAVAVLSPGGVEVNAAVTHVSVNQLIVTFSAPAVGTVAITT